MQHLQDSPPCTMPSTAPQQQEALVLEACGRHSHGCHAATQCQAARDGVDVQSARHVLSLLLCAKTTTVRACSLAGHDCSNRAQTLLMQNGCSKESQIHVISLTAPLLSKLGRHRSHSLNEARSGSLKGNLDDILAAPHHDTLHSGGVHSMYTFALTQLYQCRCVLQVELPSAGWMLRRGTTQSAPPGAKLRSGKPQNSFKP